jgi:mono/diheme cytochrome c family protein
VRDSIITEAERPWRARIGLRGIIGYPERKTKGVAMSRRTILTASALMLGLLVLVTVVGCSGASTTSSPSASAATPAGNGAPSANVGKQIYLTGVGSNSLPILSEEPTSSMGALLLGGGGCAACHGTNGHGGQVRAANVTITAPNIVYAGLIKGGYTDATLSGAITWCTDENGQPLDPAMPCWQMSDSDAASTIAYLKTLR